MSKAKKQKNEQAAEDMNEEYLLYRQGLYSGCSVPPIENGSGPFTKLDLSLYIPVITSVWVFCYVILAMGILPFTHGPVSGLALVITAAAVPAIFMLFRERQGLGPRPADRMAAMVLALMVLDFWVWAWGRPYEGLVANIFVLIDIAGFTALLFCVYMFVYRQLHIDAIVKVLALKAFFDFAAYVLCGGFGIEILSRMGITHPLHMDALFTIAMLELWGLLLYILKYRNKISSLPS